MSAIGKRQVHGGVVLTRGQEGQWKLLEQPSVSSSVIGSILFPPAGWALAGAAIPARLLRAMMGGKDTVPQLQVDAITVTGHSTS